jgi:hypothetical protein
MNRSLQDFLDSSVVAVTVKLAPRIVVQRTELTPQDLVEIRGAGKYGPLAQKDRICELEVGGQLLARGKIVRRRGELCFKVLETVE